MAAAHVEIGDIGKPRQIRAAAGGWDARLHPFRSLADVLPLVAGLEASSCQSPHWLSCWMDVFGAIPDIECFLLTLECEGSIVALAMPLVRRKDGAIRVIEFPDLGVTDYAAPLLRRDMVDRLPPRETLWALIMAALPEADMLRLNRLCPFVQGLENPLYTHPKARPNRISGWRLPLDDGWDAYFQTLSAKMQDKLGQNDRRFARIPGGTMDILTTIDAGLHALGVLDHLQGERILEKGLDYHLRSPEHAAFYRRLVETGVEGGKTLIATLKTGEDIIAVNFAVLSGNEVIYLRVANRFGEWARMSPGLIVTKFLIREAHASGVRVFDFGMGDYDYKRRLGAVEAPLMDLVLPLSLKGWLAATLWHARHRLSRSTLLRWLTGRSLAKGAPESRKAE